MANLEWEEERPPLDHPGRSDWEFRQALLAQQRMNDPTYGRHLGAVMSSDDPSEGMRITQHRINQLEDTTSHSIDVLADMFDPIDVSIRMPASPPLAFSDRDRSVDFLSKPVHPVQPEGLPVGASREDDRLLGAEPPRSPVVESSSSFVVNQSAAPAPDFGFNGSFVDHQWTAGEITSHEATRGVTDAFDDYTNMQTDLMYRLTSTLLQLSNKFGQLYDALASEGDGTEDDWEYLE